ncbi:MAG: beta-lactamase family protein [Alphaproteobacteria bacterium]|nr:beta-lactamase family protein [Alphaproteobacteria bacterium]
MMKINDKEKLTLRAIHTWLDYRSRYTDLSGFQVCIRKKGRIVFSKAYGSANLITKRPLTTRDLFHIASHSKTFTSCAVLQLVEHGKLNLQQPIITYLPELRNHKDKRFKQITLRDLLSNRSGLFRDGIDCTFWDLFKPFLSKEQFLQEVLASDLIYPPNTYSKYSNIGFSLLGLILENVLCMPYENVIDKLILKKLKNAQIFPDFSEVLRPLFADGHSRPFLKGQRLPIQHFETLSMAPATGFVANAEDTSFFFDKLLLGQGLITKEMQQELLSLNWPVMNSSQERYGLGLGFNKLSNCDVIGHAGSYPGFSTLTLLWAGTDYVISFFLNTNELTPLPAIKSIIQIIQKIDETFSHTEAQTATVSGPMLHKWGGHLFILGKKKGLRLPLDSWSPCEEAFLLKRKGENVFVCNQQSGFYSPGEPIQFTEDKHKNIDSVKWGSFSLYPEEVFLEKFKKTLL